MNKRIRKKAILKIQYNYNKQAYKLAVLNLKVDYLLMYSNNTIKINKLQNKANKQILKISRQWN